MAERTKEGMFTGVGSYYRFEIKGEPPQNVESSTELTEDDNICGKGKKSEKTIKFELAGSLNFKFEKIETFFQKNTET